MKLNIICKMKNFNITSKETNKRNVVQKEDLKNLDEFIQKCLDNFKFVEPKKELYEATGSDKDLIISHKSTIPDLVIWNQTFNKNNCFIGANTLQSNEFPRYLFYIKIKKNKKTKNLNNSINNKYTKDNSSKFDIFEDKHPVQNNENNIDGNFNIIKNDEKENNNFIFNQNYNNINYKINEDKNKFSIPIRMMMSPNINNIEINNLTIYLIQLYLNKNGWIILTNDCFSGPGSSINLFQFLQEKIKENINLNDFIIIDINKKVKYFGNYFYIVLSYILPIIIQKNKMELLKYEEIMNKENYYIHSNTNNYYYNNNINIININNNQLFSGFENNNNILDKILIDKKNKINNDSNNNNINNINIDENNGDILKKK